jgi:Flp pilus assembly protein TadG
MEFAEQRTIAMRRGSSARRQRGTTIVEFTLIFTLFFMIVGFIVQGAFLFNAWLVVTNASREAARLGAPCFGRSADGCNATNVQAIADAAAAGVDPSQFKVTPAPCVYVYTDNSTSPPTTVQELQVTATYNVPIIAPFVDKLFPQNPIPITAQSRMRLENLVNLSSSPGLACP